MKIAFLNDTHCGVRNSSDIFIEQQRKFYEEVFFPYLNKHDIKEIIHLGDYYEHRKFVNFKALNANRHHFLDHLRSNGIHMTIIPGNHDVYYKSTNSLNALKELLGYYTDCVTIVHKPQNKTFDGVDIALIPWINNENYEETFKFIDNTTAQFCGGHFEFTGFDMMKGVENTHGMGTKSFSKFEQVWSGHFHTKSTQGNVTYFGSQMEFTWADCDDPKYFHVFDTMDRTVTPVLNPNKLFTKIVYDDTIQDYDQHDVTQYKDHFIKVVIVNKKNSFVYDKFIERLNQVGAHQIKIAETFSEFEGTNVSDDGIEVEDTTVLLNSYIDNVDTDLDKEKIKNVMSSLYVESQNMDVL